MHICKSNFAAGCAAICLWLAPVPSEAALLHFLQVSDGFSTVTVSDQGVGDIDAAEGAIAIDVANLFGNWHRVIASATALRNPMHLQLQAHFEAAPSGFGGSDSRRLSFFTSATAFDAGSAAALAFLATANGSASGGTTGSWEAIVDDSDAVGGWWSFAGGSGAPGGAVAGAGSGTTLGVFSTRSTLNLDGLYSATLRASFDVTGATGSMVSGDQSVRLALPAHGVPVPGTAALVLAGLLLAAFPRRR
ncbi:MAG: hypothetical protein RJA10_3418 [Pseudomonadota bacterium]